MPDLLSAALLEDGDAVLAAHRKGSKRPFANQWLLPMTVVRSEETAEEALRRHLRDQFGVASSGESFVETVYLEDPDDNGRYVANIFRTQLAGGPMRFRADGEYDDARWLAADDLAAVWMPPPLRAELVRIVRGEDAIESATPESTDVETAPALEESPAEASAAAPAEAAEAAEELDVEPVADPPPDNRAGWDAIATSYQDEIFGERFAGKLMWTWTLSEDDLRLLDDVDGKRVIVLGCGGGQDVVALAAMGAIAVGIDASREQIAYAKKLAVQHGANNASFVVGSVDDLSRFDDASFDAAVSAHALNYVEHIEDAMSEIARVLKPGAAFAASVRHPFDTALSEHAPYRLDHAYWDAQSDWTWTLRSGASAAFRQWFWPVSRWFELLTAAGFSVEKLVEPIERDDEGRIDNERAALVPYTLAFKARKQ
jgi:ubiquinone/menaquinone biosynthesis C-methylase UbiE/ADP-ribose pyrophosphatase YjhB (NUDIX family)